MKEAFVSDPNYVGASRVNAVHIIFHELTGTNVVGSYANVILASTASGSIFTPRTVTIFIFGCGLFGAIIFIPILRIWGRRTILLYGYFACGVSLCLVGVFDILD